MIKAYLAAGLLKGHLSGQQLLTVWSVMVRCQHGVLTSGKGTMPSRRCMRGVWALTGDPEEEDWLGGEAQQQEVRHEEGGSLGRGCAQDAYDAGGVVYKQLHLVEEAARQKCRKEDGEHLQVRLAAFSLACIQLSALPCIEGCAWLRTLPDRTL